MKRHSMSVHFGVVIALTSMVVAVLILSALYLLNNKMNQDIVRSGQQQIEKAVSAQLIRDAGVLAATLSDNLATPLYHVDFSAMKKVIDELSKSGELDYVFIYDLNYDVVHDGSAELASFAKPLAKQTEAKLVPNGRGQARRIAQTVHISQPISINGQVFGGITFGLKFTNAERDILRHQQDVKAANNSLNQHFMNSLLLIAVGVFLLIIPIAYVTSRRLIRPLDQLARSSRNVFEHNSQVFSSANSSDEVGQLANALNQMTARLNDSHQKMTVIAYQDELTGLSNRRHFNVELLNLSQWTKENQLSFGVLLIDLDRFKQVNDSAGHDIGDLLLIEVSLIIKRHTFEYAKRTTGHEHRCLAARIGGDEFVVALPFSGDGAIALEFANALIQEFEQPLALKGLNVSTSLSIGIALSSEHCLGNAELLKNADLAMYAAKKAGRGCLQQFDFSMREEYQLNYMIRNELKSALINNQLYLDYQPFYSVADSEFIGAEALIRWQHPEFGLIMPNNFIELLEGSDLIHALTIWTVEQICRDSHTMSEQGINHLLSVNISSRCVSDPQISAKIAQILQNNRHELQTIAIELTETGMMSDFEQSRNSMRLWRQSGAQIWIDDFGTGYSSLSYLHELSIDVLKIDRSFIAPLTPQSLNPVVMSIFALAQALGVKVVAEGIEQEQQAQCAVALGSDLLQGFMLAKPMPFLELIKKMELSDYVQIK